MTSRPTTGVKKDTMNSSTKKILIFGGLGVAAYFVWQYYQAQQAAAAAAATPAASPGLSPLPSSSQAGQPAPLPTAVSPAGPQTFSNAQGVVIPASLQAWGQQTGVDAPIYVGKVWPNISASDMNNLTQIVNSYFNNGIAPPPSLASWWDSFTAKYGLS
jgi:hypothetical protein